MDHSGQSMLMACCEMKDSNVEVLKTILKYQPRVNQQDTIGRTALHFACRSGRADYVKLLVEVKGIDVNRRTIGGETPLMSAA